MIRFLKTTAVYFFGNVLTKIISFLLLPIYTAALLPAELGSYDLVNSVVSLVIPIAFFQIWDAIFRFSFDSNQKSEKEIIVSNGKYVFNICLVFYTIIFFIYSYLFKLNNPLLVYIFSISVGYQFLFGYISRAFMKNVLFVSTGVINSIVNITLNIILIKVFNFGVESLFISQLVGNFLQCIIIFINTKSTNGNNIKKELIISMIKFSLPLSISTISYWLLSGFTQVYISMTLGVTYNGYLSISNRFSNLIVLGVGMIQYAWNETSYIAYSDENKTVFYEKALDYMTTGIFFLISICLIVIKIVFPILVNTNYEYASVIIPISLFGIAFNSCASFIGTIFLSYKNSTDVVKSTIISAITNIIMLFVLTKYLNLMGSVISLCISFIINYVLRISILSKKYAIKIKFENYKYLWITILTMIIYYLINNFIVLILYLILIFALLTYVYRELISSGISRLKNTILKRRKM